MDIQENNVVLRKFLMEYKQIGLKVYLEDKKIFGYNKRADDFLNINKIFITRLKYHNLEITGYQILKFRNIVTGFVRNILGSVYDKNYEILIDKEKKKVDLKIKFNGKSVVINKIKAMDLQFVLDRLLNQFEIDMANIRLIFQ